MHNDVSGANEGGAVLCLHQVVLAKAHSVLPSRAAQDEKEAVVLAYCWRFDALLEAVLQVLT